MSVGTRSPSRHVPHLPYILALKGATHVRNSGPRTSTSRRTFLKQTTAAVVGGTLAATFGSARMAHASGSDILKVG